MKYLGLDLGTKTLGLAISDPLGIIATSYKILRHDEDYDSLLPMLKEEIEKNHIEALVLGFPKNMNNSVGERGEIALSFKASLNKRISPNAMRKKSNAGHGHREPGMLGSRRQRLRERTLLSSNLNRKRPQ